MIVLFNIRVLLIFFFSVAFFNATSIDFSNLNTRYWYDPNAPVRVSTRVTSFDNQIKVFLKVKNQTNASLEMEYLVQKSFEDPNEKELEGYVLDTIVRQDPQILSLTFSSPVEEVLVLKIFDGSNFYYFPVELKRGGLDFPSFYPADLDGIPIVENFTPAGKILIQSSTSEISYYLYQYQETFPPADPPMGNMQQVNPTLKVDSLLKSTSGSSVDLSASHFYFVQTDTLSTDGFTLYAGSDYFPEYRDIEKIVPTVTYFSKASEIGNMLNARNKKLAFDKFWLSLYNTKNMAKSAIASYFKKVWLANHEFTDYKEGWKTDRGIIYLIFGNPAEVYRHNKREYWIYNDVQFEFRIISNLFAPNLYILIRDEDYESFWLEQLKLIRGGK